MFCCPTRSRRILTDYRKTQLQRLQEEVVDLEDMDTGINIMDLGLNEFRLDLLAYMQDNPDVEHAPFGLHAIVPATADVPPGASIRSIWCICRMMGSPSSIIYHRNGF